MGVYQRSNGRFVAQEYDRSLRRTKQVGTFDTREDAERVLARRKTKHTKARAKRKDQRQRSDHWVYLAYDADGKLLYVGVTWQALARMSEHRAESNWTAEVSRIDVEHYPTREVAIDRETDLIQTLHPPHNRRSARPRLEPDEMTVEDVAALVGMSPAWVRLEIERGRLQAREHQVGTRTVYTVPGDAYRAWVELC